jgi:hypothetical protein
VEHQGFHAPAVEHDAMIEGHCASAHTLTAKVAGNELRHPFADIVLDLLDYFFRFGI